MARRLTEALRLRVFPDETGTFDSLLSDLSDDTAHRFDFAKVVLFIHEAVNLSQFLEKTEDVLVALCLSDDNLHGIMTPEQGTGLREEQNVL
jgi:hypothetical protein